MMIFKQAMHGRSVVIAVAVSALSTGLGGAAQTGPGGEITLERLWSPATPSGAATAAAYMEIENHGQKDDRLLGGSSPLAAKVEVHAMSMAGGIMSMHALADGLDIPAGKIVQLEPQAGYHLMLTGLKGQLKDGTDVPLTLNFARAGAVHVQIPVLPIGARGPGASMAHMDHK